MIAPMLASLADAPLADPQLVYEPKYDGIRAIVEIARKGGVRLWSRLGNEKTRQFPEITAALETWARKRTQPLVLDGEIVALDAHGDPAGFQQLQGRIHLSDGDVPSSPSRPSTALVVFDLLTDGKTDYRDRPLTERRAALEQVFGKTGSPVLRISDQVRGDGRAMYKEALERGWEGLIAKHAASLYKPGKRSPDWRKLKLVHEQEFVVGGWTEPRHTRAAFGALLIGVYEGGPGSWNRTWATWRRQSLFFGTDPVAMDHVGWHILDEKRAAEGWPSVANMGLLNHTPAWKLATGLSTLASTNALEEVLLASTSENRLGGSGTEVFDRRTPEHVILAESLGMGVFDAARIDHRLVQMRV